MLSKYSFHFYFLAAIFIAPFLGYLSNSGIIAYGPLIIFMLCILIVEIIRPYGLSRKDFTAIFIWLPYVVLASLVYLTSPLEGRYLTTHFLSIIILPIVTLSVIRLLRHDNNNYNFIYNLVFLFLFLQLVICVGQISTYTFGVGLPVSKSYSDFGMVTGTFTNSNDLAAIVLLSLFLVLGLERFYFDKDKYIFWFVVITLLVITGSRSAIVLGLILFLLNKGISLKKVLHYCLLFITVGVVFVALMNNLENEAFTRFGARLSSLVNIYNEGLSSDNSMSVRTGSYLHFIGKLPELGLGSGELNNYFKYSAGANFNGSELLFQNPHSIIVEIGYWLGWLGLVLFFTPIVYLLRYSKRKTFLLTVLLIASMIPSSILGSMLFFMLIILSSFDSHNIELNT